MTREPVSTAVLCRVYSILLYFYPREFRRRFGAEMRQTFRDRWQAVSVTPRLAPRTAFFFSMMKDWILSCTEERMASMKTIIGNPRLRHALRGVAVTFATLLACFLVSTRYVQAYVIQSGSMEGTL